MRIVSFTTVPVKPETLSRLRRYKTGGASYDEVLNDLMDDHPRPHSFASTFGAFMKKRVSPGRRSRRS